MVSKDKNAEVCDATGDDKNYLSQVSKNITIQYSAPAQFCRDNPYYNGARDFPF